MASVDEDSRDSGISSDCGYADEPSKIILQTTFPNRLTLATAQQGFRVNDDVEDVEMNSTIDSEANTVEKHISIWGQGAVPDSHFNFGHCGNVSRSSPVAPFTPMVYCSMDDCGVSAMEALMVSPGQDMGSAVDTDGSVYIGELDVSMRDASSVFTGTPAQSPYISTVYWNTKDNSKPLRRTRSEEDDQRRGKVKQNGCGMRGSWGEAPSFITFNRSASRKRAIQAGDAETAVKPKREKTCADYDKRVHSDVLKTRCLRIQSSGILERGPIAMAKLPECDLPSVLEVNYSLETVSKPQIDSGAFKSISAATLCLLLEREDFSEKFLLVDCRYPYEFDGGHIKGAINMHDPMMVSEIFYPSDPAEFAKRSRQIPIFYCEFSQKRGPTMAYALRAFDRLWNEGRYPEVDYKEMYLVDQGYRSFHLLGKFRGFCEPNNYVTMVDVEHKEELRRYHFHRSKSACSLDGTVSKERANPAPRRRRNCARSARNVCVGLPTIVSSPQEQESPTQFPNFPPLPVDSSAGTLVVESRLPPLIFD